MLARSAMVAASRGEQVPSRIGGLRRGPVGPDHSEETAVLSGVAGRPVLVYTVQHRVAIAIHPDLGHPLLVGRMIHPSATGPAGSGSK